MSDFPTDIFTEPESVDVDALRNLGPLAPLAGTWEGDKGVDVHLTGEGPKEEKFVERYKLQPIDPQLNGPQLLYRLRYWTFVVRPHRPSTFHDQVGYWLWEPATEMIMPTLTIPRGQTAIAIGKAARDARSFELECRLGSPTNGTCSNPFLDHAKRTLGYSIRVDIHDDGTWSYEQVNQLQILGRDELVRHTDRNGCTRSPRRCRTGCCAHQSRTQPLRRHFDHHETHNHGESLWPTHWRPHAGGALNPKRS